LDNSFSQTRLFVSQTQTLKDDIISCVYNYNLHQNLTGILKKYQREGAAGGLQNGHHGRPVSFKVGSNGVKVNQHPPWLPSPTPAQPSYNCWSTAALAQELPTWSVASSSSSSNKPAPPRKLQFRTNRNRSGPASLSWADNDGYATWNSSSSSSESSVSSNSAGPRGGQLIVHPDFSAATLPRPGHKKKQAPAPPVREHPALKNW
jgi:hypothetical protein